MLSVANKPIMLNLIMLSIVMLSVVVPANIKLGRKRVSGSNALAYPTAVKVTAVKSLIEQAIGKPNHSF